MGEAGRAAQAAYDMLDTALEAAEEAGEGCRVPVLTAAFEQAQARLALLEAEHGHVLF